MENRKLTRKEFLSALGRYSLLALLAFIGMRSLFGAKNRKACPISGLSAFPENCRDCASRLGCSAEKAGK